MKIVKLQLNGFKSFAEKTSFTMHSGVTCIVGPNGSGKSNVVDAFRWVLGEQSAKTLRGDKMEEVIFSGTSDTAPKGMAEVTLSLADIRGTETSDIEVSGNGSGKPSGNGSGKPSGNGSGKPSDNGSDKPSPDKSASGSDIVDVTRRLYRSGESEYYINKTRSRLKDVRELFLDTGLEVKSYSILEQGRISEILNAKPAERRFLIEEVAGVMKYKVRKSEAMTKLQRAGANLERVNDIVSEVKRSVGSLERQAKKAERYKALVDRLSSIELRVARRDYDALDNAYKALDLLHAKYSARLAELATEVAHNEELKARHGAILRDKKQVMDKTLTAISEMEKRLSGTEKDMAVKDSALSNILSHIERLSAQQADYLQQQYETIDRMEELSEVELELQREIETVEAEYQGDKAKIDGIEQTFAAIEAEVRDKNRDFYQLSEQISNVRNEISTLQGHLGALQQKKESSGGFFRGAQQTLNKHEGDIEATQKDIATTQEELALTTERRQLLTTQLKQSDMSIERLRQGISAKRESIASDRARLKSLQEVTASTLHEKDFGGFINIVTTLSTTLEVPKQYEVAVESALADKVMGVIFGTVDELKSAVAFIRQRAWDRTALIALELYPSSAPHPSPGPSHKGRGTEDVGGVTAGDVMALDVIKVDGAYGAIVNQLLGDFVIVSDIDRALELFMGNGDGWGRHYVTLDGDVLDCSGVLTTGKGTDVLRHLRTIRELTEGLVVSAEALDVLEKGLAAAISERDWLRTEQQEVQEQQASLDKEVSIFRLNLKKLTEERDRLAKKMHYMEVEAQQTEQELQSVVAAITEKTEHQNMLNVRKDETAVYLQGLRDNLSSHKALIDTTRASLTDKKVALTAKKERLKSVQKESSSLRRAAETIADKLSGIARESATLTANRQEMANDIEFGAVDLQKLSQEVAVLRQRAAQEKDVINVDIHALGEIDRTLTQLRRDTDIMKEQLNETDVQRMQHSLRMENIRTSVAGIYDKDVLEVELQPLEEGEEGMVGELKRKIADIGAVNMESIQEYEELKVRYDFLLAQQEDLLKSIAELEQVIARINSTTRKMLTESFYELNIKFNETFQAFFGGGKAELALTDPSNILESGIEIVVQPPGKKLQNINLLSGGEKSLSALSLIFAGFLIKPTPMCILDEADAALDESNTRRFSETLRALSDKTQFIVITHNRATMEIADYIYGITNETAGMSKVISMQLS
ncbi:chromosome segregation protein SMC [Candidatus Magnetobacterium casense]|uniref:Chromosome partition protein Smc n=1 Tax=Candidatus Magnetobacterium casense TaxID=1455061 RepID=A0ABS6RZ63_9BACT|nr:chromosome segregation protein SMC [Candidatus Magnetobacterium casensis]MBV6341944.1 chromosome segregation protein SMC [Candidatus Magnetobacterium casensis]